MKHNPGFLELVERASRNVATCDIHQVRARLERGERFHFVDVREDDEYAVDHARGARHIGRGVLERDIETLIPDKDAPIVLYCGGGFRSVLAAESLAKMGYTEVVSMDGGMRAWRESAYPIEPGGGTSG